jgi:hypothetical protein
MANPEIFVPYSIDVYKEAFKLYTIKCNTERFPGGWEIWDPNPSEDEREYEESLQKLRDLRNKIFKENTSRVFQLRLKGRKDNNAIICDDTPSVFLGLYLTLEQKINKLKFNARWTTITVTGDIKIEDGKIKLCSVGDIPEKFNDFKKDIVNYSQNTRDKHLFVYVSDEVFKDVKDEINFTVKHFSTNDSRESVIKYVFEHQWDAIQIFLYKNMGIIDRKLDYIETEVYKNKTKRMLDPDWKGYLIWGEGESGKSDMAEHLARYLMEESDELYAPIWIFVENERLMEYQKSDKNLEINDRTLEEAIIYYITDRIREKVKSKVKITDLQEFLEEHKYLLIIDNLEIDNVNEVLRGIKSIIEPMTQNQPYLIITSRSYGLDDLGLDDPFKCHELSKDDVEIFFDRIISLDVSLAKYKQDEEYPQFIEALY